MVKVLVANRAHKIREWVLTTIGNRGYDVIEVDDGNAALTASLQESPNIILLDTDLPEMDGYEVLKRLKENSRMEHTPIILTTGYPTARGESIALRLGALHYIAVPDQRDSLRSAVRLALQEDLSEHDYVSEPDSENSGKIPSYIKTGNDQLDKELDGGIPLQSLSMIQGLSPADKSEYCQMLAYNSLLSGIGVSYFTSLYTVRGLIGNMNSKSTDVLEYVRAKQFGIHQISKLGSNDPDRCDNPERLMLLLGVHIQSVSRQSQVTIVDSFNALAKNCRDTVINKFFTSCWHLCDKNMGTIILAMPSSERVQHIAANVLMARNNLNSMLERGDGTNFEVGPGVGLRVFLAS